MRRQFRASRNGGITIRNSPNLGMVCESALEYLHKGEPVYFRMTSQPQHVLRVVVNLETRTVRWSYEGDTPLLPWMHDVVAVMSRLWNV